MWTYDSNDWRIGSDPSCTYDSVMNDMEGAINAGDPTILLEHDLRPVTIQVGVALSESISAAGRVNCPISAAFGDPQRYQGSGLSWPVAGAGGFDPTFNPIRGSIS